VKNFDHLQVGIQGVGVLPVRMLISEAKGEDQHAKIAITLEEAYQGTTRTLQLRVPEIDPHRQIHSKTRTLNVKIPQGVVSGQKIRLRSQGPEGVALGSGFG